MELVGARTVSLREGPSVLGATRRSGIYAAGLGTVAGVVTIAIVLIGPAALGSGLVSALAGSEKSSAPVHCTVGEGAGFPAYDPVNGYIYVPVTFSHSVEIVKAPCKVIASVTFLAQSGAEPEYAAFDPQNNYVYVTDVNLNEVYVLSGTGYVTTLGGGWFDVPEGITYDPAGVGMIVANEGTDNLTLIIGTSVFSLLSLPSAPYQISIDPVYGSIDVTLPFDASFATAVPNVPIYGSPSTVYYWNDGTSSGPQQIAYDPAIPAEFVANYGVNNLTVFYPACPCSVSAPAGHGPVGVCYSAIHQYMYVMNYLSNSVWEINSGLKVAKKVSLGSGVEPFGCAYDDATNQMYVTGTLSGLLYVLT